MQLRDPSHAAGADTGSDPRTGTGVRPRNRRGRQHERVSWILAFQNRAHLEPFGQERRHVLAAVNREVDVAAEQCVLDFLDEQPLAANLGQRGLLQSIAGRLDDDDLAGRSAGRLYALGYEPGLKEGEVTSAAAKAKRAHDTGFFVVRIGPAVVSVSSCVSSPARPNRRVSASL